MTKFLIFIAIPIAIALSVYHTFKTPELPKLDLSYHWGPEELRGQDDDTVTPYKIVFTDHMIQDLRRRLTNTKPLTPALEESGLQYGITPILQPILEYWRTRYNFSERAKYLNKYPQYITRVQGLKIHFLRVRPEVPPTIRVLPLLLLHGWPGSVREFYESLPLLTEQREGYDFVFEVIAPSLPGYGFSEAAVRPGLGAAEVAVVLKNLMHRLGYDQFYLQGGAWGAFIGSNMVTLFPETVLGYHTNLPFVNALLPNIFMVIGSIYPSLLVDKDLEDRMYPMSKKFGDLLAVGGYSHLQATKPDTIGISLEDSPAGLASYILEKFITLTDPSASDLPSAFTLDSMVDNLMIYWSTNSITTSMRLYAETFNKRHMGLMLDEIPTKVPTWALQAKHELKYKPPFLLKFKFQNLMNCTVLNDGGHFIALEKPEVFSEDVFRAVNEFRKNAL